MNPIIILAAGAAALLLGSKKKSTKSSGSSGSGPPELGSGTGVGPDSKPPHGGTFSVQAKFLEAKGEPWSHCSLPPGTPKNTLAAIGKDGKSCVIFWRPETDAIARKYIRAELEKLNDSQRSIMCSVSHNSLTDGYENSNVLTDVAWAVVTKMYPQIRMDQILDPNAPYMVKVIRYRVLWLLGHDECHFGKVT